MDANPPTGRRRTKAERLADAEAILEADDLRGPNDKGTKAGDRYDQVQRDLQIYRAHLRNVDHYDLAQIYGITPKTVSEIVRRMKRENQRLSKMDPVEVVEEISAQIDSGLSELAAAAAREKGATKIAAINNRINGLLNKAKWLQASGLLPKEPEEFRIQMDGDYVAHGVMAVLEKRGMLSDPEVTRELLAVFGAEPEEILEAEAVEELPPGEPEG
jgi:hypothetical protein